MQTALGLNPSSACFLLKLKSVSILLDCGAELAPLLNFAPIGISESSLNPSMTSLGTADGIALPHFDQHVIEQLDVILITNFYNMLSLPYLTENYGFKGKIVATEPTVQLGRQVLIELSRQLSGSAIGPASTPLLDPTQHAELLLHLQYFRKIYSEAEILASCSKIEVCSFDQKIRLMDGLEAVPYSSGYCLGSCNWLIKTGFEKIVYAAQSVGTTTNVRFHAQPLKSDVFSNADCVIMSQLALPGVVDLDMHFGDLCNQIGQTLAAGGTVLLPISSAGMVLDLFALLDTYMVSTGFNPQPGQSAFGGGIVSTPSIPMYFVSSISESVLAYANISAEWLSQSKQERVYTPNNPFTHTDLLEAGKLFRLDSLDQFASVFRSPSIVFTGNPSLRCGEIVPLLEMLKHNPQNTVIFTDPGFDPRKVIAPFEPCSLSMHVCPLDSRLSIPNASDLMKRYSPRHLIVPNVLKSAFSDLSLVHVLGIGHMEEVKIKLDRKYERGYIAPDLASKIEPRALAFNENSSTMMVPLRATLHHRDGEYTLKTTESTSGIVKMETDHASAKVRQWLYGSPAPQKIVTDLEEMGVDQVEIMETGDSAYELSLPQLEASLLFTGEKTTIKTSKVESRKLLKEILLRSLHVVSNSSIYSSSSFKRNGNSMEQ